MAESIGQRAPLPSLAYLDTEKIKREQLIYNNNIPVTTSLNMAGPPSLVSPSTTYSGPPPPYSYPSSAASSSIGTREPAPVPPPAPHSYAPSLDTRPSYNEEKERPYSQAPRQSLPSISEALNGDHGISISSLLSPTTAPPAKSQYTTQGPTSPVSRSFVEAPPKPHHEAYNPQISSVNKPNESYERSTRPPYSPTANNFSSNRSPPMTSKPAEPPPRTVGSPSMHARPAVTSAPSQHPQSPAYHHYQAQRSPPPTSTYVQKPYQPAYSFPTSNPGLNSYTTTSLQHSTWRTAHADAERAEEIRRVTSRESPPPRGAYGESVKRHLDIFDIETSLNEIADGSGHALEFARAYGTRAHQTQRSGPIPGSLPPLAECDNIMRQQQRVLDSMTRIRELILRQQQALAEQRIFDQRAFKAAPSEADEDAREYMDKGEGGGGFAGAEAKKRRGRAAPPGRCHSCNRAETPEWRRGPDGARTLCNACGLHYAKLQRKMDSKDSGAGPSKLRPKESTASSP